MKPSLATDATDFADAAAAATAPAAAEAATAPAAADAADAPPPEDEHAGLGGEYLLVNGVRHLVRRNESEPN